MTQFSGTSSVTNRKISFKGFRIFPKYMCNTVFIDSSAKEYLVCFQSLVIAGNMKGQISSQNRVFNNA